MNNSEVHLFLIWEKARLKEKKILEDINIHFKILNVFNIEWSQKYFSLNLTRFYGQNLPPNSHKELHCGKGAFLLIIVEDEQPIYEERNTSHGLCNVNIKMFDKKQLYRKWTGGGHKIHATDNLLEVNHNLSLLLGLNINDYLSKFPETWDNSIKFIKADPPGTRGWNSIRELFYILNNSTEYVVLRNFEGLPDEYTMKSHGDIDLMGSNPLDLKYLINAQPVFPNTPRVLHYTIVNNEKVLFDFRYLGDNYYDIHWQKNILETRILTKEGFYRPTDENYFYSLLYHALIHKPSIANDYLDRFPHLAQNAGLNKDKYSFESLDMLKLILKNYLTQNKYQYTEPNDLSVYLNLANSEILKISIPRIFSFPINLYQKINLILKQTVDKSTHSAEFKTNIFLNNFILRYHFSPYRHLIIKILELPKKSKVIEIGAETGVITRYLCEEFSQVTVIEKDIDAIEAIKTRCKEFNNIDIINSPYTNVNLDKKFDVAIILINMNQGQNQSLLNIEIRKKIALGSQSLEKNGKLILAIENENGYRNNYVQKKSIGTNMEEIKSLLDFFKLDNIKTIYPFPDHLLGQIFITEKALELKKASIGQWAGSIVPFNANGKRINIENSLEILSKASLSGTLKLISNSFIIIASDTPLSEESWFIKAFNGENRRNDAWTETELVSENNNLIVNKSGNKICEPPFIFNPNCSSMLKEGETLEKLLIDKINNSDLNAFISLLNQYCEHLIKNYKIIKQIPLFGGTNDISLSGETFDLITRNIIISDNFWFDFDKEWQTSIPVPLSLICFRSIQLIIEKTGFNKFYKNLNLSKLGTIHAINDAISIILRQLPYFNEITSRHCDIYQAYQSHFYSFVLNSTSEIPSFLELYINFLSSIDKKDIAFEYLHIMKKYYSHYPELDFLKDKNY